ncbi:MAG: hypothetical protein EON58_06425 [Alphaproteobacteria bacterium]|nr:MAG: hypothetical protein EON58_06425 [Alphaproteobacteria bacterium]
MANPPSLGEARKRSVDNLQRLYTVVVSLAITELLKRLFHPAADAPKAGLSEWLMLTSFIVTIIPFYHGANRYLDATYVTGERSAKHGALMLDFIALFLEGILLFVLGLFASNATIFYTILGALFVFDAAWVGLTRLTTNGNESVASYVKWAGVNVVAALAVTGASWTTFFKTPEREAAFLTIICVFRTVYDYYSVWSFYYPPDADKDLMMFAAPRPAMPDLPSQGND